MDRNPSLITTPAISDTTSIKQEKQNNGWWIALVVIALILLVIVIVLAVIYGSPEKNVGSTTLLSNTNSTSITPSDEYHTFIFENQTSKTIYPASLGNTGFEPILNGGWKMNPGDIITTRVPKGWQGRFWARTGCVEDANGNYVGPCDTGDCGRLECGVPAPPRGGQPPVSLAEFTLDSGPNQDTDFYDSSNVDGFSIITSIIPIPGTFIKNPNDPFSCGTPTCTSNGLLTECPPNAPINTPCCPPELVVRNAKGEIIACQSACLRFNTDQYCCRGIYGTSQTCIPSQWPVNYVAHFKAACNNQYAYAYDDATSTFTCQSMPNVLTGYKIVFSGI